MKMKRERERKENNEEKIKLKRQTKSLEKREYWRIKINWKNEGKKMYFNLKDFFFFYFILLATLLYFRDEMSKSADDF